MGSSPYCLSWRHTGYIPFLAFKFMEPVYYIGYTSFPQTQEKLGHWVGVATGDVTKSQILNPKSQILNLGVTNVCS